MEKIAKDKLNIDSTTTVKQTTELMKEDTNYNSASGYTEDLMGDIKMPSNSSEDIIIKTEKCQRRNDIEIYCREKEKCEREINFEYEVDNGTNKVNDNVGNLEGNNENRQCDPCLFDEVKENANSFCVVCVEYLCKGCARDHRRSKATRKHKVLIDKEMPDDPKMFQLMKSLVSCPDHPEMEVSFKCKTHKKFICTKCLVVTHRRCEDVTEISNQTLHEQSSVTPDSYTTLQDKLQLIHEKTVSVRNAKEENIKHLQTDSSSILIERSDYIKSIQEHLLKLDEICKMESDVILTKALNELEGEVDKCRKIEMEENQQKDLLDVALNYGNAIEVSIICEKVERDILVFKKETTNEEVKPVVALKFDINHRFEDISSIGSVRIVNGKQKNDQESTSRKETYPELSSDEFAEKTLNVVKDMQRKPLMQSSVSKRRIMYDIQSIISGPSERCSVTSILTMPDGRVVLTDYSNKRIKLLNSDFTDQMEMQLDGKPIDMCQFSGTDLIIISDGDKCIKKYLIGSKNMFCNGNFPCKFYPISIGNVPDNGNEIAILLSSEERKTFEPSVTDRFEIQIRRINDGKILQTFNDFKLKSSQKMMLQKPGRICMMPKTRNAFLISDSGKLQLIEPDRHKKNILNRKWYFNSNKEITTAEITDIAADNEGNIYICNKGNKNIYQISGKDHMNNRTLLTVSGTPLSLCFDDDRRQLIVGCEEDDFIYVIKLE